MIIEAIKTNIFEEGEDLFSFVIRHIKNISEDSVLVVTSKIVSLAEKRTVLKDGHISKDDLTKKESELFIKSKHVNLTIKNGVAMASAGIDESNAKNKFILLPKDSFRAAKILRKSLMKKFKLKQLGVVITDSRSVPLRAGAMGVALGYAGFCGIKRYGGKPDIFGRKFKFSRVNVADSLAVVAVLAMGEGNECQPLALIKEADIKFCNRVNSKELYIDIFDDLYRPLFLKSAKWKK